MKMVIAAGILRHIDVRSRSERGSPRGSGRYQPG